MHGANIPRSECVGRAVDLKVEGVVTYLTTASWQISRFHNAVEGCFRYKGRTVEVNIYDRYQ